MEGQLQLSMSSVAPGSSMELACLHIGSLQVQQEDDLAFMCGSLLVPRGTAVHSTTLSSPAVVQSQRLNAPRYRLLPTETDLNSPPLQGPLFEHTLPVKTAHDPGGLSNARGGAQSLSSLALSALLDYGDTIDVVAPVDILKQIFKTPYSKARLSVGVHRIGQTLVLCNGPETEEGEKVSRRKKNQGHGVESKLFSKFVQHSVNTYSFDSRTSPHQDADSTSDHQTNSHINAEEEEGPEFQSSPGLDCCFPWQVVQEQPSADDIKPGRKGLCPEVSARSSGKHKYSWTNRKCGPQSSRINSLNEMRTVGEQQQQQQQSNKEYLQNEADGHQRTERFLRVLYWEFEHMRMLLGSDLFVFSNEKHAAVSLHLLEIDRQVAPLVWLDAWLDNVMASIPELAVCYHRKGVVQGYELLKTEDIFLVKGLSKDGTSTFHPHVVQQNASSILRFLQNNCKQDPGTYWLFKNAGEDHMHLFDLSAMSKSCPTRSESDQSSCGTLPSVRKCSKGRYTLPLAMLLYRLAHSFAHSQNAADQGKCVNFFEKCLKFMDEQEHLVVRSSAHEHLGRVWLNCLKELGLPLQSLLLGNVVVGSNRSPLVLPSSGTVIKDASVQSQQVYELTENDHHLTCDGAKLKPSLQADPCIPGLAVSPEDIASSPSNCVDLVNTSAPDDAAGTSPPAGPANASSQLSAELCFDEQTSNRSETCLEPNDTEVQDGLQSDLSFPSVPISPLHAASAALTAVHHISQAIKALRWQRKLDDVGTKGSTRSDVRVCLPCNFSGQVRRHQHLTICVCGEIDCIPLCDIKDPELRYRMDHKLWRLVLLLGESYLALGQAYKDAGELTLALRAAELACLVRSCIPQRSVDAVILDNQDTVHSRDQQDMHSKLLSKAYGYKKQSIARNGKQKLMQEGTDVDSILDDMASQERPGKGLFWGLLWMFLGDVYVERHRSAGQPELSCRSQGSNSVELKVIQDVAKEVKRLKKRVVLSKRNCNLCSLTSCSCQSERADSGSSASSSSSNANKVETFRLPPSTCKKSRSKKKKPQHVEGQPESTVRAGRCGTDMVIRKGEEVSRDVEIRSVGASPSPSNEMDVHSCDEEISSICASVGDMSSYFRPQMTNGESNLLSSVNCYQAADLAFQGSLECVQDRELALRKKGWAANELGRSRLQYGNVTSAYESFRVAIQAFSEVKDHTNVILVHCNLGHGHRASAESIVLQLPSSEENMGALQQNVVLQAVVQAKRMYAESLREYNLARQELTKVGDGVERGLWNEVHTQLAHTYLKLGMLVAREEKISFASSASGGPGRAKKSGSSATDSISKALVLYESLGNRHAQEAAYAQFQLACHEKNCCVRRLATQVEHYVKDKSENGDLVAVKRHAHLAELYWQKAMEFYRPETHTDMFLEILMERSALCVTMAPLSHPNPMLDMALTHLLEGRRVQGALVDAHESSRQQPQPSVAVYARFIEQLRALLKKMLTVAMSTAKLSTSTAQKKLLKMECPEQDSTRDPSCNRRGGDVLRLKEVYRHALAVDPDLGKLHSLWMGSGPIVG